MELILFIYLKTKRMKKNWKNVLLYIVRIIELLITGAAGGAHYGRRDRRLLAHRDPRGLFDQPASHRRDEQAASGS